jgi:hypothetical protein
MSSMRSSVKRDNVEAWLDHGRSPRATIPVRARFCDSCLVFDGVRWTQRGTVTADLDRGVEDFALIVVSRQDEDVLRRVLGGSLANGGAGLRVLGRPERDARTTFTSTCFRRIDGEVFPLTDSRDDGEGDL